MDTVGKVNRGRAFGQHVDVAGRRKDEDARGEFFFDRIEQVVVAERVVVVLDLTHHVAIPRERFGNFCLFDLFGFAFFVRPVGGNPNFRHGVHHRRANLNFKDLSIVGQDRRMQRLVHVCFGNRNVILESFGDGLVMMMNDPKGTVTLFFRFDDDAQRKQVKDFIKILAFGAHLLGN